VLTESIPSNFGDDDNLDKDRVEGNIIQGVKIDAFKLKSLLPGGTTGVKNVKIEPNELPLSEYSDLEEYREGLETPKKQLFSPSVSVATPPEHMIHMFPSNSFGATGNLIGGTET
jgi:hypothetical protein